MWHMTICTGRDDDLVEGQFSHRKAALDFLEENYPAFLEERRWRGEGDNWFQFGMDYFWAQFQWKEVE